MSTKAQQILDPQSDWNQTPNEEPVFVLRALNWKAALIVAAMAKDSRTSQEMMDVALAMRKYHTETDIPF